MTCAGFHVLQESSNNEQYEIETDIEDHFFDYYEMTEHHEEHYQNK